ncbi:MAG TPA: DUF1549 domain-containing protein, partial [Planctomycetaceae bacterium]|nr:DUF1549 domain-containing protein [Planctomycetaceae bacterium]
MPCLLECGDLSPLSFSRDPRRLFGAAACVLALLSAASAADDRVDYERQVKPILREKCFACHGAIREEGSLRLDTAALARKGGDSGSAIEPGRAAASLLIERVTADDESVRMPQEGTPLDAAQIATLSRWIDDGAAGPADEQPERDPREHWSFRPPARPAVPVVRNAAWTSNPIDSFIAAEHDRHGLAGGPLAPKEVLLRRVSLDLIGLPPTRNELHEFLADDSEDAYTRVVDRLLASPQHGQRWARHWMDVWR